MSEHVPRAVTWDEIETGFHEYAADLTKREMEVNGPGDTSYPPEFADWAVGVKAAREWLAAHDACVRRDAAREALDGYADAEEDSFLALHVKGAPISAAQCTHAAMTAREYRDTHYPYRQEQTNE